MKTTTQQLTPNKGRPEMPKHLIREARKEWNRVCDELDMMGTLSTADKNIIAMYCIAWARWLEAEDKISEQGAICLSPKEKTPQHNPWFTVSQRSCEQLLKYAKEQRLNSLRRSTAQSL
jgi:P27 family predicted phage terminase small subunit